MTYESELLIEVGRQCQIAFDSDIGPALEGFGSDFADIVSGYMTNLSEINNGIPRLIANGDVKGLQDSCNQGIKLCTRFREELKKLPPDKLATIRNLMPCFKSLVAVMSIVMTLGGAKKIANIPQLAPVISKLATVDKLPPVIKTLIYGRLPALRKMIVKDEPVGKLGKLFNVTTDAGNAIRSAQKIVSNIKGVMNDSKYAKMLSEEDTNDQNTKNRKYAAMLGQINDMIAIYQRTRDSAKEIIAEANQEMDVKTAEESLALLAVPFCENYCRAFDVDVSSAIEAYYELAEKAYFECAMEAALDVMPIAQRYTVLLNEITSEIPQALQEGDTARVIRLCKQGIRTCERCKDELRALPPDRFARVRNFIPSYDFLMTIWLIFESSVMGVQRKLYIQNGQVLKDMAENGAFLVKLLVKAGIAGGTEADVDEAFALTIELFKQMPQYSNIGKAGTSAGILTAVRRGFRPIMNLVNYVYQFIKQSEYMKYLEDTDYSDPNIGNRKYRALIGELNQMIIMFTCMIEDVPSYPAGTPSTQPGTECWLI